MINLNVQVRHATPKDQHQISNLIFHESNTHRHLDWRSALDWIGSQNYWVLEEHGFITAAFACPEDPPNVAWIRLFTHHPHHGRHDAWSAIWESVQPDLFQRTPQAKVSAIVLKPWFENVLSASGFQHRENVVILRLQLERIKPVPFSQSIRIRRMTELDLPFVMKIDLDAFGTFWHNDLDALRRGLSHSIHATVAENESGLIGYQLSTGNRFGAHLARLAVHPEAQGQGVATSLIGDLIQSLQLNQTNHLSVNTQDNNFASLALYQKMGFVKTGEYFPVLVYEPEGK